jgi:hypothetical protein
MSSSYCYGCYIVPNYYFRFDRGMVHIVDHNCLMLNRGKVHIVLAVILLTITVSMFNRGGVHIVVG